MLHQPTEKSIGSLLLTHGAGSNAEAPLLIACAKAFCNAGFLVLRYHLPFRQKRPSGPPHPGDAKADQAAIEEALASLRAQAQGPVIAGGHSYGGRQASVLAAAQPGIADALLLLSYPLHPPKKPLQMRTAHWPDLQTPSFFFHGTKDPFGTIEEMQTALRLIPASTELGVKQNAGHDLAAGRFDIAEQLIAPFVRFVS